MNTKEELAEALSMVPLAIDDEDTLDKVRDLLEALARHVEEVEPYATKFIDEVYSVASQVYSIQEYLE